MSRKERLIKSSQKKQREIRDARLDNYTGEGLNPFQQKMANFSDLAYNSTTQRKKTIRDADVNDVLDHDLSTKYIAVVRNDVLGETYINHRGTKLKDFNDLSADIAIATGTQAQHKRFKEAEEHLQKVKEKYGNDNIILTGHSLGGAVSGHLARKYDLEAHMFNPGASIGEVRGVLNPKPKKGKLIHYKTDAIDPISVMGIHGADEVISVKKKKGENAHSLKNFL